MVGSASPDCSEFAVRLTTGLARWTSPRPDFFSGSTGTSFRGAEVELKFRGSRAEAETAEVAGGGAIFEGSEVAGEEAGG